VQNNARAAKLREKGWSYYAAPLSNDKDDGAIAWRTDVWKRKTASVLRMGSSADRPLQAGTQHAWTWSTTVVLKRIDTGHTLLVSVSHLPAHVEGRNGWRTDLDQWRARKAAYLSALKSWSTHVKNQDRKHRTDASLIVADWNLNLKEHWVQDLLANHWGKSYDRAWRQFPTTGGSLTGGAVGPLGAPGKSSGDRIIDGSLIRRLKVTVEPDLMARVRSSDHRPFHESFRFLDVAEKPTPTDPGGDTKPGVEWWGFGDYSDDEIYSIDRVPEEEQL